MPGSMLVHDTRVKGRAPRIADYCETVNGKISILDLLSLISNYARNRGGLNDLYLMCHGISWGGYNPGLQMSQPSHGWGLEICHENLTLKNLALTSTLRDLIWRITLYSCAPAETTPGLSWKGFPADGRKFCSELAGYTNAYVLATDAVVYYDRVRGIINDKPWQGTVYQFNPDGSMTPTNSNVIRHMGPPKRPDQRK